MVSRNVKIVMGVLVLFVVTGVALAALGPVTLSVFTPESLDPNKVLTFTDANSQMVNGSDLVVPLPNFPATKGIEIHSEIPGAAQGSIHDITSFQISFNYFDPSTDMPGMVNVDSFGAVSNFFTYDPWTVTGGLVDFGTGLYTFTFTETPTSAPVNDNFVPGPGFPNNQSFATATITGDQGAEAAFSDQNMASNVVITPGTDGGQDRLPPNTVATPEFGSVFSLGGLLAGAGAAFWFRRRRVA